MARIRSRGYPNAPLEQVIENAAKIHGEDRQHPVDRETVAKHIGFSGLSGASDRALSALLHFGLTEKVRKGEIRVSDLALRIIHPSDEREFRAALHEAGFFPELFKELRDRYPDAPPSRDTLTSYLSRIGFASAAINPATKAYLETCSFLQREDAYDSPVASPLPDAESAQYETDMEPTMQADPLEKVTEGRSVAAQVEARSLKSSREMALNEPHLDIRGTREVHIEGVFDRSGLDELENTLKALKMLLKTQQNEKPEDAGDPI